MKTDSQLKKGVEAELTWEPSVTDAHIGVAAQGGVVTLSGRVPRYAEKWAAKRVCGVQAVANEIEVKLPGVSARTDEEVAAASLTALASRHSDPRNSVKAVVSHGWETLEGEAESGYQRDVAHDAVCNMTWCGA